LRSSAQREALAELTAEMDNFRAAWDWAITHDEFALIEQTMRMFWMLYDTRGWFQEGLDTLGRAVAAQAQGEHQQAVVMFRKGLDTFTELGGSWWVARVLAETGRSFLALGNEAEAERVWREALRIATETHGTPVALEALIGLASLQAKRGNMERALDLLLMVLNHLASFQETKDRAAHLRAELEAHLTRQQVDAAHVWVQATTFEAAVAEILQQAAQRAGLADPTAPEELERRVVAGGRG
jgi:tetratricopeptide (TPR) repeat protein